MAAIVGQPAHKIAAMAGITVPESTKVLLAERAEICSDDPFAHENFRPCWVLPGSGFHQAVNMAEELITLGGQAIPLFFTQRNQYRQHQDF